MVEGVYGRRDYLSKEELEIISKEKMEESEEYKLMKELDKVEDFIAQGISRLLYGYIYEIRPVRSPEGLRRWDFLPRKELKNPIAIKARSQLSEELGEQSLLTGLLDRKIKILKEMIELTEKQMKQDTQVYELEEKKQPK